MEYSTVLNKEVFEQDFKIMEEKIDKLYDIYNFIFDGIENENIKSLDAIKKQNLRLYNKIIETGEFDKYKEIEEIIFAKIYKIELDLKKIIYMNSKTNSLTDISSYLISQREVNSTNFEDIEKELKNIELIKEVLNLYIPYINKSEIEQIQYEISDYKFDILFRKQIKDLIYGTGEKERYLLKYDDEKERQYFIECLNEKISEILIWCKEYEKPVDKIFKTSPEKLLEDKALLERLIIFDITTRKEQYIWLLESKIFNAHLCNIGNNPFPREEYVDDSDRGDLILYKPSIDYRYRENRVTEESKDRYFLLKTNNVNFSLLKAVLKNIITDENISIIECEYLYNKFGFECNPIVFTDGQKLIKLLWKNVKNKQEFFNEYKNKKTDEGKYCKLEFNGLAYEFFDIKKENEEQILLNELLIKRKIEVKLKKTKTRFLFKTKKAFEEYQLNEKIEKLILKALENKNGNLTVDEFKTLLLGIKDLYDDSNVDYNEWEILPLENINKNVWPTPTPQKTIGNRRIGRNVRNFCSIYMKESDIKSKSVENYYAFSDRPYRRPARNYYVRDLRLLWKKYLSDFEDLGIDIKQLDSEDLKISSDFCICMNLDDISDLPIDYNKVQYIEEQQNDKIKEEFIIFE